MAYYAVTLPEGEPTQVILKESSKGTQVAVQPKGVSMNAILEKKVGVLPEISVNLLLIVNVNSRLNRLLALVPYGNLLRT